MIQEGPILISDKLVNEITNVIINMIIRQNKSDKRSNITNCFSAQISSDITVSIYIERLIMLFKIEGSTLIHSLIYLDRVCKMGNFKLSLKNFHLCFLTSLVIATKFNEDKNFKNNYYAKVGGITLEKLNRLEKIFLVTIDYSLFVMKEEFNHYSNYFSNSIKS